MLVVDSSALVAIALDEPEKLAFAARIIAEEQVLISPINRLEIGQVLSSRMAVFDTDDHRRWFDGYQIEESHLVTGEMALQAFLAYGKGRHPARLNLGDCFAYALAKALDAPLLFKGDDFPLTDVKRAI